MFILLVEIQSFLNETLRKEVFLSSATKKHKEKILERIQELKKEHPVLLTETTQQVTKLESGIGNFLTKMWFYVVLLLQY